MRAVAKLIRTLSFSFVALIGLTQAASALCYPLYYFYGFCTPTQADLCHSAWSAFNLCGDDEEEEEEEEEEEVVENRATHDVYLTGRGVFPIVTFVELGDTIRFINLDNEDLRMEGRDNSWKSDWLDYGEAWELVVDNDTYRWFRRDDYNSSRFDGEFRIENLPEEVDFAYIDASFIERFNLNIERWTPPEEDQGGN